MFNNNYDLFIYKDVVELEFVIYFMKLLAKH